MEMFPRFRRPRGILQGDLLPLFIYTVGGAGRRRGTFAKDVERLWILDYNIRQQ